MSLARRAERVYLTLDPRSLGLFRILFATLLLYDLARRAGSIALWYADGGPVSHASLPLSLFQVCSSSPSVAIGFLLCAAIYLALLAGYRTRVAQLLTFVAVVSLHNRCPLVERSGEKVLDLLALWTLFLPLGARFSLDARDAPAAAVEPRRSLAVLALLLQISAIYFLSGIQKSGATWRSGTAIHYLLQRSDIVTALGLRVRDHLPLGLVKLLSWATTAIELALPALLLSPIATVTARRIAILLMVGLNLGIALAVDLGIYQPTMVCLCALLLSDEDWARVRLWRFARATIEKFRAWFPPRATKRVAWKMPRLVPWVREGVVALALVAAVACAINQNDATSILKHRPLPLLETAMADLGLPEAWSRFAPDVPQNFRMLAVDAITADGRHVDPLAFAATGDGTPLDAVPDRLGFDTFWHNYERTLGTPQFRFNQLALESWIMRHGERTGRAGDRVISFSLYSLVRTSPPPGETVPQQQRFGLRRAQN